MIGGCGGAGGGSDLDAYGSDGGAIDGRSGSDARSGCTTDEDCDDGLYCNGREICDTGLCREGANPCAVAACDEAADTCGCENPDQDGDGSRAAA